MRISKIFSTSNLVLILLSAVVMVKNVPAQEQVIQSPLFNSANIELEQSADDLYEKSEKLFDEQEYWECARNLIILLDVYPNYSKIDQTVYMLGECLYETGLLDGSKKILAFFATRYYKSTLLPDGLCSLQRIEYDKGNYDISLKINSLVLKCKPSPSQSILDYTNYYAGLAHYQLEQNQNALDSFNAISEKSPYYSHGLYQGSLALLKMTKINEAFARFHKILRLPVYTSERQQLLNETHLTLGYLYYEMESYAAAIKQFNAISREYENYQNVLLSSGWTASKMGDYKEAVLYLTDFISNYEQSHKTPESLFLLGRCYLKLGLYAEALQSYDYLIEILPENNYLPETLSEINNSLEMQLAEIEKTKMDVLVMESKFVNELPLNAKQDLPGYVKEEKSQIDARRVELFSKIRQEHQQLNELSSKIRQIQNLNSVTDQQRSWRAFAEYGKSRAMFLYKGRQLQ
ncbi:MAG TPA: tetratricopeptide repeat protein [bacterium]|nr:tetratricopeptide repeat protein [bacterium]HPN43756.1 tetratricopeptide repeat protein [bacterium]